VTDRSPNRDKRTRAGRRRYARRVGDYFMLLAACRGSSRCVRAYSKLGDNVCSACGGAVLGPEEKRGAAPPG
jgi:hypothetical protein